MATTAAGVSKVLYNAGIRKSKEGKSRICNIRTEGYVVETNWKGEIIASYHPRTQGSEKTEIWLPRRAKNMAEIAKVLTSKGYTVAEAEFGLAVTK